MEKYIKDEVAVELIKGLAAVDGVEAIALGGSRANGVYDEKSDYDIYVYCGEIPPDGIRLPLLKKSCSRIEAGNDFWEYEDDVTLKGGVDMDILYRNLDGFAQGIKDVAENFNAHNGYTTCMWYNLVTCKILYDKGGRLGDLQRRYTRPYPAQLQRNIIERNMRLINGNLPSYDGQIKKAAKRKDFISVNHRVTEYFASYFDVVFALNKMLHPGEKRLLDICEKQCHALPENFRADIENLLKNTYSDEEVLCACVDRVTDGLKAAVEKYAPFKA